MRGSLRRRDQRKDLSGPQRWELRVYLGRDQHGREKQATRAFSGNRREAESALAAFVAEVEQGRRQRSSRIRFRDYAQQWISERRKGGELAIKTLERYESIVREHLVPHFGVTPLSGITASDVRTAMLAWRSGPRADHKAGTLSQKSIHDHFALLRQMLSDAVRG